MKLFKVELSGRFEHIPTSWVIANDPTEAENIIEKVLNESDYGFSSKRKVLKIELIAEDYLYAESCGVLFQKDCEIKGLEPKKKLKDLMQ